MSPSSHFPEADLLRQIAERSLDGFFVYNLQSRRFDYVNAACGEIWDRDSQRFNQDLPGLLSSVHPEDFPLVERSYGRLLAGAFRQSLEFRLRLADEGVRWVKLTAYVILKDEQRHSVAGFAEDITSYKDNELTANKFSIQKNAVLETLAHDLGGPLGVIRQVAGQLEQEIRQNGYQQAAEDAGLIRRTSQRSIRLIKELLEREFLESAQAALKKQRVELVEQLDAMLEEFRKVDQQARHQFRLEVSSPQVMVEVDQTKFMQAISNLVINAVKFTPDGGRITVGVEMLEHNLRIKVADDGIGIPASLQPVLFERFTSARRPGIRGEETVGLGLSIVKRIVELHQGRILVESEENKGTTFSIDIPMAS